MKRLLILSGLLVAAGVFAFGLIDYRRGGEGIRYGQLPLSDSAAISQDNTSFTTLWASDFKGNRVLGFDRAGKVIWEQNMGSAPLPASSYNTAAEYVTVAPSGNLILADGDGMMVQEIDRATHKLVWQYGVKDVQGSEKGFLHQPDKAYKISDFEVLINDGNNRRVIIVDQRTDEIVWQYGETLRMGSKPGLLRGNTSVVPLQGGREFLITDTLEKKILIVDRATKQITWEWTKPDAKWLQHAWPTGEGTFILEDRQKNEVFEVNRAGVILWTLNKLADGSPLRYPTDVIKLGSGNVLIAEAGRSRVIEVIPETGRVVSEFANAGFVTTIAIDSFDERAAPAISFVGPRENIPIDAPVAHGFWSFAMPVPGVLSRSGQPLISEFEWLKQQGWRGVINFRVDGERGEVGDDAKLPGFSELGLSYLHLPITDGLPPTIEQAEAFLAFVTNPANQPVHIHCRGGIGRAGTATALYRYAVQDWPMESAIEESRAFKGGVSTLQKPWLEEWAATHEPGSHAPG